MPSEASPERSDAAKATTVPSSSHGTPSIYEPLESSMADLRYPPDAVPTKKSAIFVRTFDDDPSRAIFKYPRFSTAASLTETGGPSFSLEELTSTEVSEDEDAILNEPKLRRRTLSRLSVQLPSVHVLPPVSIPPPDVLQKATGYIRGLIASFLQAIINYMQAAHGQEAKAEEIGNDRPPNPAAPSI